MSVSGSVGGEGTVGEMDANVGISDEEVPPNLVGEEVVVGMVGTVGVVGVGGVGDGGVGDPLQLNDDGGLALWAQT